MTCLAYFCAGKEGVRNVWFVILILIFKNLLLQLIYYVCLEKKRSSMACEKSWDMLGHKESTRLILHDWVFVSCIRKSQQSHCCDAIGLQIHTLEDAVL